MQAISNVEISLCEGCHGTPRGEAHSQYIPGTADCFPGGLHSHSQALTFLLCLPAPVSVIPITTSLSLVNSLFPQALYIPHPASGSFSLAPLQLFHLIPSAQQALPQSTGTAPSLPGCMSSSQQFLPFPLWFKAFSQQPGFQTPSYELCFIPPSRQTCFSFWLLIPFHHPGEPVSLQSLCACQLTCPRPSSCPHCVFFKVLPALCFPRRLEGQVCPSYLQTWHGPEQPGTGAAGPALIPQPWAVVRMELLGSGSTRKPLPRTSRISGGFS